MVWTRPGRSPTSLTVTTSAPAGGPPTCQVLTCCQTFRLRHGAHHARLVRTSKYAPCWPGSGPCDTGAGGTSSDHPALRGLCTLDALGGSWRCTCRSRRRALAACCRASLSLPLSPPLVALPLLLLPQLSHRIPPHRVERPPWRLVAELIQYRVAGDVGIPIVVVVHLSCSSPDGPVAVLRALPGAHTPNGLLPITPPLTHHVDRVATDSFGTALG
jgi:hypothetical protein